MTVAQIDSIDTAILTKRQLESEIRAMLNMYQNQFGLAVRGIHLRHSENLAGEMSIYEVCIETTLP